jgi:hypothetical protein
METRMAIVLLCAALAANLPFILNKVAGVWAVPRKHVGWCLLELGVLYCAVGGLAYLLESQVSPVHVQKWQFYVTTFSLFLVLAFPGFIARFFWKRRR